MIQRAVVSRHILSAVSVMTLGLACFLLIAGCTTDKTQPDNEDSLAPSTRAPGKMGELQDCLEAAGWEVQVGLGTLTGPVLPVEQLSLYDADFDRCAEETQFSAPLTAEDLHRLYPLEVAHHQCLIDNGYESESPPSEQQFVEDWLAVPSDRIPYEAIGLINEWGTREDYQNATQVCPPPLWDF